MQVSLRELNMLYIKFHEDFLACIAKIKAELINKGTVSVYDENILQGQVIKTTYLLFQKVSDFENWISVDYPVNECVNV